MFRSEKPFTAVTVQIENLTSEHYDVEDSSGIVDLIEAIQIQATGPREASRALRKKLKYGNLHRQLRALTILDYLIQNAGDRFLREFADEPLLERLRIAATDPVSDPEVRKKCQQLFAQWAVTYKGTPGMAGITGLYQQLPKRKQPAREAQAKVLRQDPDELPMGHSASVSVGSGPAISLTSSKTKTKPKRSSTFGSSSSRKDKRSSMKPFNLEKERPEILQAIAAASVAATNLENDLKLINREVKRVREDERIMAEFEKCKSLRRQILRYIQHIESGDLLGSLINANEQLVAALMAFEVLDRSVDYDSDSEEEELENRIRAMEDRFVGLSINKPPRPPRPSSRIYPPTEDSGKAPAIPINVNDLETASESEGDDDNEDNPFGDRNAVPTPSIEKDEPTWREV
ncbi:hypothetical protein VTN31DRAFT_2562 [Thermomyces dupontii]|uniref:uncharacterized protein n=1 Tax=Talaromyces thermophilus TaxID=28565 RepID=UPI00374364AD